MYIIMENLKAHILPVRKTVEIFRCVAAKFTTLYVITANVEYKHSVSIEKI